MCDRYLVTEFSDLTETITTSLGQTQRVKFTCCDASPQYLILGATSGSLYIFKRQSPPAPATQFLKLIPNKYGAVSCLAISSSELFVAFATVKGFVVITSMDCSSQVLSSDLPQDSPATCFYWMAEHKLFYGNRNGEVVLVNLASFMSRSIAHKSTHPILLLENPITQISGLQKSSFILVSTTTKTILCNTEKEEYKQIGNRPRDGDYGACFHRVDSEPDILRTRIYCARPGLRLWECDMEGNVLKTHQLKAAIADLKPTRVLKKTDDNNKIEEDVTAARRLNKKFTKLLNFSSERYVISHSESSLFIFDTRFAAIVMTITDVTDIQSVALIDPCSIVILTRQLKCFVLKFSSIDDHFVDMLQQQNYAECCSLVKSNLNYIRSKMRASRPNGLNHQMHKLRDVLKRLNRQEMLTEMEEIFLNFENEMAVPRTLTNGGGILIVNNLKNGRNSAKAADDDEEYPKICPNDDGIVVKMNQKSKMKAPLILTPNGQNEVDADEKEVWNLYMICKSSIISNTNFTERFKEIFDTYKIHEIIKLITKLHRIIMENDDPPDTCARVFFDYLRPEIIWEIDDNSRSFISTQFITLNAQSEMIAKCQFCSFPIAFATNCFYPEIGHTLLQYYWSRSEQDKCLALANQVSYLIRDICKFYIQDKSFDKIITFSFSIADEALVRRAIESFHNESDPEIVAQMWRQSFAFMRSLHHETTVDQHKCLQCHEITTEPIKSCAKILPRKISWVTFLNIAIEFISAPALMGYILEFSEWIPNSAIGRELYLKCLLNGPG